MSKIKSAVFFSAMGNYSVQILGFVTIIIITRILTPDEIGTYAVAGSVTLLAAEIRTLGVVQYLVREKELDESKIRSVLGMAIIVSWSLGLIFICSAPIIAEFYSEPALRGILWILGATFFIGPFTSVPNALWRRNLQFQPIFIQKSVGALTTSLCSILLVLLGLSYYGLAIGVVTGLISELIVVIYLRPAGTVWLPRVSWLGELVKFGFFASSTNLFIRFSEGIPDLVIGRVGTMADVGQFSRGLGAILFLNRILVSAVGPVVLPHFSEVNRSGKSLAEAYLKAINLLLVVSWPVLAVASAAAFPMIHALFGDQWDMAVSLTSIVAIWAILTSVHSFAAPALIVKGAENLMFLSGLIVFITRLTLVIFSAQYGLEAVAWPMVASGVIELMVNTWALRTTIGLSISGLIKRLLPNLIIAASCWITTLSIDYIMPFEATNPWQSIGVISVCLTLTWLLLLRLTRHEGWYILKNIISKRNVPGIF